MGALLLAAVAVGISGGSSGSPSQEDPSETLASEPRLDGTVRPSPAEEVPSSPEGPRPTVVRVVPPNGSEEEQVDEEAASDEEAPPRRVLEQNAALRRQLDHLQALEAERARVARALRRSGAIFAGPVRLGAGGLAWPVNGPVVSPFGQRWGRLHAGVDIAAPARTVIRAAANGTVAISAVTGGYGNYVCVQHTTELTSCYAHLSGYLTQRGETVRQGDPIGLVGCTGHCFGDHLHFETWVGGRPVDPMAYF